MKYGIFLPGLKRPMRIYEDMFEAYEAAKYFARESEVFHEVKEVKG